MKQIPIALTIAGSDSSGGAGIQADLKSFSANGVYGASVLTALTAQNTQGVSAIFDVTPEFVTAQIDAVFSDLAVDAVKIGMLSGTEIIEAVAEGLIRHKVETLVLDPVMVTTTGDPLLKDDAVAALAEKLFPLARLITPNLFEAARITGEPVAGDNAAMEHQADRMHEMGAGAVLVKGGHGTGGEAADLLSVNGEKRWLSEPRIMTENTHGTGCSLSSAIAAHLAKGSKMQEAVRLAKHWLTGAIRHSDALEVGKGAGPVHHFHNLWSD